MKKKTWAAMALACLLLSGTAAASDWTSLPSNGEKWYMDMESAQKIDTETKNAWFKIVQKDQSEEKFLMAITRDGMVQILDRTAGSLKEEDKEKRHIIPDTPLEEAYHKLWSKKERSKIQKEDPNKWEQKGEDTADSAINRAVWKVLSHIGW